MFEKDRVMGACLETFVDVGSNVSGGYEGFSNEDGNNMKIPMMYSQGLDMPPKDIMGTQPSHSSEGRRVQADKKGSRNDQLKAIAE